jgi:drug/metabolite transporter (DMT)-like permease
MKSSGGAAPLVSPTRATGMLVLVTLFWGLSFPLNKNWHVHASTCPGGKLLASLTLISLRMSLGALILGIWQPRLFLRPTRKEYAAGLAIGVVFFLGIVLQVWGLAWTTPAMSAFFTSLGSAWVPLLAWLLFGIRAARLTLIGMAVGLLGTMVLAEGGWRLGLGELLTLVTSVVFAAQILLLDRVGRSLRPEYLTAGFLSATALLGIAGCLLLGSAGSGVSAWVMWTSQQLRTPVIARDLLLQVMLPTVLGFHWMNAYQPYVPASRAALIYLLEPVFSAIFSVLWGHDQVTGVLLMGGGLILSGNLLVELPGWLGSRARAREEAPLAGEEAGG